MPHYHSNASVLKSLEPGDLIQFPRAVYSHWGVYLGDERVGHLAGIYDDGINGDFRPQHVFTISGVQFNKARVAIDNFWDVVDNGKAIKNNKHDGKLKALSPQQIIRNVLERVGEVGYNVIYKNCEHFANLCRYGIEKSEQVEAVLTGVAVGAAGALAMGLVYAFAKYFTSTENEEDSKERKRSQLVEL